MYRIVDECNEHDIVLLSNLDEGHLLGSIIVAEKGEVQDVLVCGVPWEYHWSSLYCRSASRTHYRTIMQAIRSRLEKGMAVHVFRNRGEFRSFIKYNGERP